MEKDTCGVSECDAGDQSIASREHHRHTEIGVAAEYAHNEKREVASPDNRDGRGGRGRNDEACNPKDGENKSRAPSFFFEKASSCKAESKETLRR